MDGGKTERKDKAAFPNAINTTQERKYLKVEL